MKRLLIALSVLATGTILFCALRIETERAVRTIATRRELWRVQEQRLQQMRQEHEQLGARVRDAKREAALEPPNAAPDELAAAFATNGLKNLSANQAEKLLAEFGFDWSSPGDYLFVSKSYLPGINMSAIRGAKLTGAVRTALAITPGEQGAIEAEVHRLNSEYASWLLAHAQREEPSGDVLAKYSLVSDPQFSQTASNSFAGVTSSTLGTERAALFEQYAWNWMESMGMFGRRGANEEPTTMTVTREAKYLKLDIRQSMSSMSCAISPAQPFPQAFRPLFPGGWKELADREGFELPKEFK